MKRVKKMQTNGKTQLEITKPKVGTPAPYFDTLDWDSYIQVPPPAKVTGKIKVRFKYTGRTKP